MFWLKVKSFFSENSGAIKNAIYALIIAAVCTGFGIPMANQANENAEQSALIDQQADLITQSASDYDSLKADFDQYVKDNDIAVAAAQARADAAYEYAFDNHLAFNNFYNLDYLVTIAQLKEDIDQLNTDYNNLANLTGPIYKWEIVSDTGTPGMVCPPGATSVDGVLRITIENPLAVAFNGQMLRFMIVGEGTYLGYPNVRFTTTGLGIHIICDNGNNGNGQCYLCFVSDVIDVPGHSTITAEITFHIEFEHPVESGIVFSNIIFN